MAASADRSGQLSVDRLHDLKESLAAIIDAVRQALNATRRVGDLARAAHAMLSTALETHGGPQRPGVARAVRTLVTEIDRIARDEVPPVLNVRYQGKDGGETIELCCGRPLKLPAIDLTPNGLGIDAPEDDDGSHNMSDSMLAALDGALPRIQSQAAQLNAALPDLTTRLAFAERVLSAGDSDRNPCAATGVSAEGDNLHVLQTRQQKARVPSTLETHAGLNILSLY